MKPYNKSWNRLFLLITTMLFTPTLAAAQDEQMPADDEEIVVLGNNIPEPMRETSEVATFLSVEELERTGDDNAAQALTRLTGLSVVSNRFVFVRGLGDRYSSALLNGSPLPSPEPLRRQVPLDLFPSNILDGATVQKTFSPNYPGEFGGGIIDLRTLRMPVENFFTIKAATAYNTESTGSDYLTYYGESSDWSTVSDGRRELPGIIRDAIDTNLRINSSNFSDAELEAFGESFTNSPLTVIQREEEAAPDFEGEVTAGASFDLGRYNVGLLAVGGYDSTIRSRTSERVLSNGGAIERDFEAETGTWDIVGNLFGSASIGWDENEIALTGLLVRTSTKYAQVSEGTNTSFVGGNQINESTGWYERQLASLQLAGDHTFGQLDVDWRVSAAESTRDAPYERSITYLRPDADPENPRFAFSNSNAFSYLTDTIVSGGVDLTYTIPLSAQRDLVVSGGFAQSNTERDFESYSFSFNTDAATPPEVLLLRPDFLFSPDNIAPNRFEIEEDGSLDRNYTASLDVLAAYGAVDVEIMPLLRAAVGVRYEDATQEVDTFVRYTDLGAAAPTEISNEYWLPAATLTWNFADDLQLRLGYSQTIARPQFRELAFTPYFDPESNRSYQGNPRLTDSELTNYDARLEYYFNTNQFVTVGAFYKDIQSPIEEVVVLAEGGTQTRFINAPSAILYGIETDYRVTFDAPIALPFLSDASWLFAANYTYTSSEVSADGIVANPNVPDPSQPNANPDASQFIADGSPLQGTPEHLANLQFGIETEDTKLTLLVGYASERILIRGTPSGLGVPTVFEDPGVNVDLVFRQDFQIGGADLTLGLAGRNLLGEEHEEYQTSEATGRTEFNSYARGSSFSISLSAKY